MSDTDTLSLAEGARPAWDTYRTTFPAADIAELIADLLHLADAEADGDTDDGADVLHRATRDWEAERSDPSPDAG
ncbi:hypothetical protein [Streptomyces sp. NPDC047981]|uniref:hypothetical protein n=1 Tax=Streptomyces sp. NPDC047981 TaxID=3154610 RepID=UPI00341617E9